MTSPRICFGQQPCGIFPKNFLIAKIETAKKLQEKIGGKIIYFCHDSDHDYRETITPLEDIETQQEERMNFTQENKWQKKYSPLYLKRIPAGWQADTSRRLHRFVSPELKEIFAANTQTEVADFCLEMYIKMGILDGIEILRSSSIDFRSKASPLGENYFVEVPYEGEIVRARYLNGILQIHRGGEEWFTLPDRAFESIQCTPSRDYRLGWMQSVIQCTHYIAGKSEIAYMNQSQAPEITYIERDDIAEAHMSYIQV